jgi:hypothetical protein
MLAIVRIALNRPYTFIVAALLILIVGTLAALRTPVDIFPSINIPIIGVAFQYQGLPPDQGASKRFVRDLSHLPSRAGKCPPFRSRSVPFSPNSPSRRPLKNSNLRNAPQLSRGLFLLLDNREQSDARQDS